MLVVERKQGEFIVVGDNLIRIVLVDIRGDKVRIGVEAPREIAVDREEVYLAKKAGRPAPKGVR